MGIVFLYIAGSDPDKCLFLRDNRFNLGCFFLLAPGFWGQKQGFKQSQMGSGFPYCGYWGVKYLVLDFNITPNSVTPNSVIINFY